MGVSKVVFRAFSTTLNNGEKLNEEYLQLEGFTQPILILDKFGLEMRMPANTMSVGDIVDIIGMLSAFLACVCFIFIFR